MHPNHDLPAAMAAAREALRNSHATANERPHWLALEAAMSDLLAALDAAQGDAVLEVVGGADGWRGTWEHKPLSEIEVGTMRYLAPHAPPAAPRVERYGDGVLVHWPEGVEQYVQVGDCVTGNLAAPPAAVPAVPEVLVRAYFHRFSEVEDDYTIYHTLDGVCEQCIPVLIVRAAANKENGND
ncbi:MAG: hypothetical protein ACK5NX_03830 [Armatimonadota bacterium]